MTAKQRPPRFDDVAALSKMPPKVSPFANAGLARVTAADFPVVPEAASQSSQMATTASPAVAIVATPDIQPSHAIMASHKPTESSPPKTPNRKDTEQLNVRLPIDLMEDLRRWCFTNRVSTKDFIVSAIQAKLKPVASHDSHTSMDSRASKLATFDDVFDGDDRTIIDFYEKVTDNTWDEEDHAVLQKYRDLGVPCITLAIAKGRNGYRDKINSFKFFEQNIRRAAAMQPNAIEDELRFQMAMLKRRVRL